MIDRPRTQLLLSALVAIPCLIAADTAGPSRYTGPGSCSSPSCHGGVEARDQTSVLQNEYSTWVVSDKHAQAYAILTNPVGTRIAKIMGLPSPETAPRCLACHALDVPAAQRARTFDLTDGVGCENCHGPASAWLGPHTTRGWKHEQSIELGQYDTRDLVKRSEKCLSCHLGTQEKTVDHELIAAGHPDLYFELDSFLAVMPPHWKERDTDPWFTVRAMAVGQAVQLREQLKRVARESQGGIWPEYAELDCFACHHNLTAAKENWRQERGYSGRRPGNPPFNLSRYVVLKHVAASADRAALGELETGIGQVYAGMTALNSDRRQVGVDATKGSELAGRLAERLNGMKFDGPQTRRLLKSVAADGDAISEQGERAAEQATMALDSLFIAYTKDTKAPNDTEIRAAIHGLFRQLDDPSSFNGFKFAAAMKSLSALLP